MPQKILIRYFLKFLLVAISLCVAGGNAWANPLPEDDYDQYNGLPITKIIIEVNDVFDTSNPEEDGWIYKKLNSIQVNTKEKVIKDQLLFSEGDVFSAPLLRETVRKLDARSYNISADSRVEKSAEESLTVTVIVRNAWTLKPRVSYGREGGEDDSAFGVIDTNFLGLGDSLAVTYKKNHKKTSVSYSYSTHRLFNSEVEFGISRADTNEGQDRSLSLRKPFRSLASPFSWGAYSSVENNEHSIKIKGDTVDKYRQRMEVSEFSSGFLLQHDDEQTLRLRLGLERQAAEFSPLETALVAVPEHFERRVLWAGLEYIEDRFARYKNIRRINQIENLNLGTVVKLRYGVGDDAETGKDLSRFVLNFSRIYALEQHSLVELWSRYEGFRYSHKGLRSATFMNELEYHYLEDEQNRWFVRLAHHSGFGLEPHEYLSIGDGDTLRGYPLGYASGTRRVFMNLERRAYFQKHWLNLFYLGAVAFIDIGKVSGVKEFSEDRYLADYGLGLRISPSKLGEAFVIRWDWAWPVTSDESLDNSYFNISVLNEF